MPVEDINMKVTILVPAWMEKYAPNTEPDIEEEEGEDGDTAEP